uniref:CCHC-type domain-containing protein n=1 Tax=Ditylenchus dipsaci TaxID=166011 RepID=A0A915E5L8_9BILA
MEYPLNSRWRNVDVIPVKNDMRITCFRCSGGHMVKNCKLAEESPKCFNCNRHGHKASGCRFLARMRPGQTLAEFKLARDKWLAKK